MTLWKQDLPSRTDVYMNSQRLWQNAQELYSFKPIRLQTLPLGSGHGVPFIIKKLFETDASLQRGNQP